MAPRPLTPIERDPSRLAEALPWYRNDTLGPEDRAWVEAQLAADPSAREAADFDGAIAESFEARLAATPADVGWQALLARVRTDGVAQRGGAFGSTGRAGRAGRQDVPVRRLSAWFTGLLTPRFGMAMAALLVAQTVAIGVLVGQREEGGDTVEYRSGAELAPVATIRALLNESLTEQEIRAALIANRAVIIDGPNALGEYWILAQEPSAESVAAALRDAGVIASFAIDHRPRLR